MPELNRREMLGSLGALAVAGGWLSLSADEAAGQTASAAPAASPAAAPAAPAATGVYKLPPLDYAPDALEPHIDAQTMTLHHDKHHAAYVNGANDALAALAETTPDGSPDSTLKLRALMNSLAFNGAGHVLHSVFWKNMKKGGGGEPAGDLAAAIARDFGTFGKFQGHFNQVAEKTTGSGWSILAWEPLASRLIVLGAEKHQNIAIWGAAPLLVLDVWEHAYYLKYQNKRADYIKAFWNVVDWENVNQRLAAAKKATA